MKEVQKTAPINSQNQAIWEKSGYIRYIHKGESFLIMATCSKCNNSKEFVGRKTENGVIDFDYTKIDAFCSVCGAEMSNAEQPEKKNHLEKAFEECADQLKQEAVKMIADNSKEPVKEKYPYYSYNTDVNGKEGKYKIVFETDDRNGYRQLEEYIRENFIDKENQVDEIVKIASEAVQARSCGFLGFGKCLKCGNTYTLTSEKPLKYCMACGTEIKSNWS